MVCVCGVACRGRKGGELGYRKKLGSEGYHNNRGGGRGAGVGEPRINGVDGVSIKAVDTGGGSGVRCARLRFRPLVALRCRPRSRGTNLLLRTLDFLFKYGTFAYDNEEKGVTETGTREKKKEGTGMQDF